MKLPWSARCKTKPTDQPKRHLQSTISERKDTVIKYLMVPVYFLAIKNSYPQRFIRNVKMREGGEQTLAVHNYCWVLHALSLLFT